MSRKCKICESKLRNEIDELLVSNNYTADYISKYATDRGLVISPSTVRRHGTLHVSGYNPSQNTNEVRKIDVKPPKLLLIDFDEYLLKIGIDRTKIENVDEFFEENISSYQKGINLLMFQSMAILSEKLENNMRCETKFPSDEIKSLKAMSEIYTKAMGIDKAIDENVAINHLQSLGYDIKQTTIDV